MSLDVLFIASDIVNAGYFEPENYAYMQGKYGLSGDELTRLITARIPSWQEDGVPMSVLAAQNWFSNGRRFSLSQQEIERYFAAANKENRTRLGNGIYVSDHLVKEGLSVELVNDLSSEWDDFLTYLARGPRVVAISTTFMCTREGVARIARRVREADPNVPIVIGGPLVHYSHKIYEEGPHLFAHPHTELTYFFGREAPDPALDIAIIDGRGEKTLAQVVKCLREGRSWKDLPNVAYPDQGKWVINPCVPESVGVNEEGVRWDTLDEKFLGAQVAVRGSRGCPLRCKFCSFVVLHTDFSVKAVDVLRDELRRIASRSDIVKHVSFVDDNLFLTRKSVDEYCKMMAEEGFPFTWSAFMRIDSITEENVKWIAGSGCVQLMLGIESGDLSILKSMRKGQRPDRVLKAMELLTDHGISTISTMLVGFPGETEETMDNTIALLNSYPDRGSAVHWYAVWVHMVTPLTPVDKEREKWSLEGILLDWKHDTMDVAQAFRERDRMFREVRKGGAYIGPYGYDMLDSFIKQGNVGTQVMREFFKHRHRMTCLDQWQLPEMDGMTRTQTLDQIERLILDHAELRGAV